MPKSSEGGEGAWVDPDDAPELDDAFFDQAEIRKGGVVVREMGRPLRGGRPLERDRPKIQVTLRLDADLIEHFKADGAGWQTRLNAALREAVNAAKL